MSDEPQDIDLADLEITYEVGATPALPEGFDPQRDLPLVAPVTMVPDE